MTAAQDAAAQLLDLLHTRGQGNIRVNAGVNTTYSVDPVYVSPRDEQAGQTASSTEWVGINDDTEFILPAVPVDGTRKRIIISTGGGNAVTWGGPEITWAGPPATGSLGSGEHVVELEVIAATWHAWETTDFGD